MRWLTMLRCCAHLRKCCVVRQHWQGRHSAAVAPVCEFPVQSFALVRCEAQGAACMPNVHAHLAPGAQVGPVYRSPEHSAPLLEAAYRNSLQVGRGECACLLRTAQCTRLPQHMRQNACTRPAAK